MAELPPLENCAACGGRVWLRVIRMSINRRPGVYQWLEHFGRSDCKATAGYYCHKFRSDKSKPTPYEQMRDRWNKAQRERIG